MEAAFCQRLASRVRIVPCRGLPSLNLGGGLERARSDMSTAEEIMKPNLILLLTTIGATIYMLLLRRQLQAARLRGDMYREISARLDRQVAELRQSL